ncbi:unnamed protein product [Vitrella brassicaformis CCMP3155]|uniref:Uncharacterized protein n=1 Tax=Vitrella brassicaformis (strain CCMP3155) TaxID=1169540 RepID=A0A0G4FX96_VITBC|nr:unnamed protein product [Vitrella brassicaformis CCMP3155]|eukprot:CEM20018.1 unnamed protein product [Vitrella brassicaformis CCMP3155]
MDISNDTSSPTPAAAAAAAAAAASTSAAAAASSSSDYTEEEEIVFMEFPEFVRSVFFKMGGKINTIEAVDKYPPAPPEALLGGKYGDPYQLMEEKPCMCLRMEAGEACPFRMYATERETIGTNVFFRCEKGEGGDVRVAYDRHSEKTYWCEIYDPIGQLQRALPKAPDLQRL